MFLYRTHELGWTRIACLVVGYRRGIPGFYWLYGSHVDFYQAKLAALYPAHAAYVSAFAWKKRRRGCRAVAA